MLAMNKFSLPSRQFGAIGLQLIAGALLSGLLGACSHEHVVLLPSPDGRQTGVVMRAGNGDIVLDKPYASLVRWGAAESVAYESSLENVESRFGAALAMQPMLPSQYLLYFEVGGETLTAESPQTLERIKAEIARRPAPEILIVGHTDSTGSTESNDLLSARRAGMVRDLLLGMGVPAGNMEFVGRGERDLLIPTADEVEEARNRRVEVLVR